MRRLTISGLLCLAAFPALADARNTMSLEWAGPPIEARTSVGAANAVDLPPFPSLSDIADTIYGVPVPRSRAAALKQPNASIEEVCDTLASAARKHRIPTKFFIRLIWQESRFDPTAVSPVGAQGVAQFMPQVAYAMGLDNPFDPIAALPVSARLLRELLGMFKENLGLAAAAYNAGPKLIFDWLKKGAQLPEETRNYVLRITGHDPERWRKTKPGRLELDVPQRAPCRAIAAAGSTENVGLVPAPVNTKKAKGEKKARGDKASPKTVQTAAKAKRVLKARKALVIRAVASKAAKRSSVKLASRGRAGT